MRQWLRRLLAAPGRYYFWGSAAILVVAVQVISSQVADRAGFANGGLREDVMARWGAPISQSGPSVRFVESGSIFSTLEPLALDRQRVFLDAQMSYRKRGLVYFSGFEFGLRGEYAVTNPRRHDIDVVFVFPLEQARRSMLRDLRFRVNGEPADLPLSETADKLVWTGRLAAGASATFEIRLRGRGLATCRLDIDGGLFRLRTDRIVETREGVRVLAGDDGFGIEWEVVGEIERGAGEAASAPAIESVVSRVHASTVSTLEGRRITRVLYDLRFAGRRSIAIGIPEGQRVERAFLNGVAIETPVAHGELALELTPARAGEEGGTLELVLAEPGNEFHLTGDLRFELPTASWPVHELFYTLHLPRVFDYRWTGGSLEPAKSSPPASFSYRVPLPGRPLHLHQVLIADSAADVTLDYAVNLDGHYFKDPNQGAS
jgi:hypothetical protein